jgi:2-oxoglutarate ferredoxin oxidoreductase subunit alpha
MMEPAEIIQIERYKSDISAYAANGESGARKRNIINSLYLVADELERQNLILAENYKKIRENEVMFESDLCEGCEIAFVAYGMPSRIVKNAVSELKKSGVRAGVIRPITLWPFPDKAFSSLPKSLKAVLVCELSMGQMVEDVRLALNGRIPVHFYGRTGGVVFEPDELAAKAREILKEKVKGKGGRA